MASTSRLTGFKNESMGRVLVLFLLFLLAIYNLNSSGLSKFSIICLSPLAVVYLYFAYKYKMMTFWILFVTNYFLHFAYRTFYIPLPMSLPNELFMILLLVMAVIDTKDLHSERLFNLMGFGIFLWCTFCTLEVLNDTCDIGIDIARWFTAARLFAYQLIYIFLVFSIYISTPKILHKYLKVWGLLTIFAAFWVWKQKTFGFTQGERIFLESGAIRAHFVGGIMRYFSVYSDAANYGCSMGATSVAFYIFAITARIKKDKLFYLVTAIAATWGMFQSGTRTAIFCMILGFMAYVILSKSVKIALPVIVFFSLFVSMLAFTNIGNGNDQIRRMRSAFDPNDNSKGAREMNQEAMRKYMKEAPWGIGLGISADNCPKNNKFYLMSKVPPDSEYVNIWLRTGKIGLTVYLIHLGLILLGGCLVVLFKIKNPALRGIGAGMCCAFAGFQVGAYGNQVLMQFPNGVIYFGGMAIVYVLPFIESDYNAYEAERQALVEEKKRLKKEEREKSRVKNWLQWI